MTADARDEPDAAEALDDARRARDRRRRLSPCARAPATDRADRGRPRGPPVRRREAAVPARDRRPRRHGPGDRRRPPRRPRGLAPRPRHPAADRRRPGRAGDRPGRWRTRRPLRRRRRRPALAGVARDPGDRGLPPARDEVRGRADPRRRFRLHDADAPPSPVHRRARPVRGARPAVPVRDRLRIPRAVRADQPRRDAAARRSTSRRGSRRRAGKPITEPLFTPEDPGNGASRRARRLMATERLQKVLAASGVASRRASEVLIANGRVTVDGKRATARHAGRPREGGHRRRRPRHRRRLGARVPAAPQAGRRDLHGPRPPRLEDGPRHDPDRDAPRGRPALPGRPPRPGFGGPARADQRRGVGRPRPPSAPRHRARVRDRPARAAQPATR